MNSESSAGVRVWGVLLVCAAMILGAMAWLTREVVASERERSLADERAGLQERIRLSLWRMDAAASAVMIEENERTSSDQRVLPENPMVRMRFRVAPDGRIEVAVGTPVDERELARLNELLAGSSAVAGRFSLLCEAIHIGNQAWDANSHAKQTTKEAEGPRLSPVYQQELNVKEKAMRGGAFNNAIGKSGATQGGSQGIEPTTLPEAAGLFQAAWMKDELILLRGVLRTPGGMPGAIEGVWIKAPAVSAMLLEEVRDLLPNAVLEPVDPEVASGDAMALASLPWRLVPGEGVGAGGPIRGPVMASLAAGWLAAAVALLAGALLVRGVMNLSERRASFVSAVTHELRTPLTTFRLYADMLESGAVTDEARRAGYFKTLRREADRLSHLVENVLAFSRIERGNARSLVKDHRVESLLEGMRERFEERLAAAGMSLEMEFPNQPPVLRGDAAAIEHILFNLIDNAAKYAAGGDPACVTIAVRSTTDVVEIVVSDHGPGLDRGECERIFRPFHKSAQSAADSQPGVGLGLALSRRLARGMGGGLDCREGGGGACFVLRVPVAGSARGGAV